MQAVSPDDDTCNPTHPCPNRVYDLTQPFPVEETVHPQVPLLKVPELGSKQVKSKYRRG